MTRHSQRGYSLIEFAIGLVIFSLMVTMGVPSFSNWIQNSHIRTASEDIQNGLQLARAEAVRRNQPVNFQTMTTADDACALSAASSNWVISLDDPTGACATPPSDAVAPRIIQMRAAAEGSINAVVAAGQSSITFNGLGRLTPVPAGNIDIDISNPSGGTCIAAGGNMRCLRIVVSTFGQVRMCDPTQASTTPQGC